VWTGIVRRAPEHVLLAPLKRKKPTTYFVNSMSDLFHEDVPDAWIDQVFAVMALCPQHTFQVLTKRAARMRQYMTERRQPAVPPWPLPNVWLGVSTERQREADERIPLLLATPAAVRFISAEPLLGPVDLTPYLYFYTHDDMAALECGCSNKPLPFHENPDPADVATPRLDWIIVGGESGTDARPMQVEWADQIVAQCREAGVKCFVKQLGASPTSDGYPLELKNKKGGDPAEWPDRLQVREMPKVAA
jgi:protein gp37